MCDVLTKGSPSAKSEWLRGAFGSYGMTGLMDVHEIEGNDSVKENNTRAEEDNG